MREINLIRPVVVRAQDVSLVLLGVLSFLGGLLLTGLALVVLS